MKAEVATLLQLKQKLAAATGGTDAAADASGGKGGKGKSKGKKK